VGRELFRSIFLLNILTLSHDAGSWCLGAAKLEQKGTENTENKGKGCWGRLERTDYGGTEYGASGSFMSFHRSTSPLL